jgi:uncharacterized protein (DUF433 family)
MAVTDYPHLSVDDRGRPVIAGANTKVIEVAADYVAYGWDASEIHRQHPHLTLTMIESALNYFHDHRDDMERQMRDDLAAIDAFIAARPPQPDRETLEARLRACRVLAK